MLTFVENFSWILLMVLALGVAGGVVVHPFAKAVPFAVLMRPFGGLLLVATGTLVAYVVLGLDLATAGTVTWVLCSLASLTASRGGLRFETRADAKTAVTIMLLVTALATLAATASSILAGGASFVYLDWTDRLGYAHMADWLNDHEVQVLPALDANHPYQSWPHFLVTQDPRFGSFTVLALVSRVLGLPGTFSYDMTSALVLTTSALGLAGLFARSRAGLVVLALGLLTSHWFDYTRAGFFAKAIAFPASFFAAGLFIVATRLRAPPWALASLVACTAAAALMQSGPATALFLSVIGCSYLACLLVYGKANLREHSLGPTRPNRVSHGVVALLLSIGVAIVSSGTLARPVKPGFPDWHHTWGVILPRIADLEAVTVPAAVMSIWQQDVGLVILSLSWAGVAILAVLRRDATATALAVGPALLLLTLWLAEQRAMAFQMIGVFYPLGLCGTATLVTSEKIPSARLSRWTSRVALGVAGVAICLHCPRLVNTGLRYSLEAPKERTFQHQQLQELAGRIGHETVEVDLGFDRYLCIAVLVELGRRGVPLRWSPDSWRAIVSYRHWPAPTYPDQAPLTLLRKDATLKPGQTKLYETNQFKLVRNCPPGESYRASIGAPRLPDAVHAPSSPDVACSP